MFARFAFLFALCFGLAVAPVRLAAACAAAETEATCHTCCAEPETACCEISAAPLAPAAPAKIMPSSGDAKLLVAPALFLRGLVPQPAMTPTAVHRQHAARIPAPPVLRQSWLQLV